MAGIDPTKMDIEAIITSFNITNEEQKKAVRGLYTYYKTNIGTGQTKWLAKFDTMISKYASKITGMKANYKTSMTAVANRYGVPLGNSMTSNYDARIDNAPQRYAQKMAIAQGKVTNWNIDNMAKAFVYFYLSALKRNNV